MAKVIVFRGYNYTNADWRCAYCGLPFNIGDKIVKTARKRYHAQCFECLLH